MSSENKTYVLFPSHNDGLALEKVLRTNSVKYTIVPTPRELSKCCGIAIMLNPQDKGAVEELIGENIDINIEGIHTIQRKKRNWFG